MNIPIDLIDPNPEQPREVFNPLELTELAASIKELTQEQPPCLK